MWLNLLMAMPSYESGTYVPPSGEATPQFTVLPTVTSAFAGFCSGGRGAVTSASAAIQLAWSLSPGYGTSYYARIYENDILVSSNITASTYTRSMTGLVESGGGNPANLTFRVDIVRRSDSAVVASRSSAQWTQRYAGTCP